MPEGDPHREPDEQCHQRLPPVLAPLLARRCAAALVALALRCRRSAGVAAGGSPLLDGSAAVAVAASGSAVATAPACGSASRCAATVGLDLRFGLVVAAELGQLDLVGEGRARVPSTSAIRSRRRTKPGSRSFQAVSTGEAMKIDE